MGQVSLMTLILLITTSVSDVSRHQTAPPADGAPGRIRTCDARFRKPTLYPLSYGGGGCRKPGRNSPVDQRTTACSRCDGSREPNGASIQGGYPSLGERKWRRPPSSWPRSVWRLLVLRRRRTSSRRATLLITSAEEVDELFAVADAVGPPKVDGDVETTQTVPRVLRQLWPEGRQGRPGGHQECAVGKDWLSV